MPRERGRLGVLITTWGADPGVQHGARRGPARERTSAPPTVRFYSWRPDTLSLGYFQRFEDVPRRASAPARVVRRITGGGAIHHVARAHVLDRARRSTTRSTRARSPTPTRACTRRSARALAELGVPARAARRERPRLRSRGHRHVLPQVDAARPRLGRAQGRRLGAAPQGRPRAPPRIDQARQLAARGRDRDRGGARGPVLPRSSFAPVLRASASRSARRRARSRRADARRARAREAARPRATSIRSSCDGDETRSEPDLRPRSSSRGLAPRAARRAARGRAPNVLLITIDTLRADRLSAAGYARATTPNLDRARGARACSSRTPRRRARRRRRRSPR